MRAELDLIVAVEIEAPRAAVWKLITDPQRMPDWLSEFESAQQESEGPPGLGTTIRYTLTQGHRSGTFDIVEWEPEARFSWDGPPLRWAGGGARPRGTIELAEGGPGRTRFTGRFRPELTGMQVLLRPYLKRWLRRERRASAAKLKALLEEDSLA